MRRSARRVVGRTLFYLLIGAIFVYLMFPFYWAIVSALKTQSELIQTPATLWPSNPVFANFRAVLSNDRFIRALLNSTIVAGSVTVLSLLVGSFAGYALGKMRFRGKEPSLYVILAMTMFPQIAVLAGLYAVIRVIGMPAIPSMILSYLLFTLPFTVWVLTAFFRALPDSLLQAAQVDGATLFQSFRLVLLPLAAPAMVTTGLLAFIQAWNEYLFALTFTIIDPPARTVPVAIALFTGEVARQEPFGEIMAAAVLVTVPLVVLVLVFQQRIVAGLTAGAVKG
ncbi:MAG TPA: carbohydrate ABC transporter permease [Trueperaceae bacterium]|nr:carbohydrate ABC transporter permease [Trueperaceae bacterium]